MDNNIRYLALEVAKSIQDEFPKRGRPPEVGISSDTEQVLPISIIRGTRGYISKIANQINGCYENGWYDACAVMMRRLLETLLIETFENNGLDHKIKNTDGNFLSLEKLIDKTLAEQSWNLGRDSKKSLPRLKKIGDLSAHNRRYVAHRNDLEKIKDDFRVIVQELVYIAKYQ